MSKLATMIIDHYNSHRPRRSLAKRPPTPPLLDDIDVATLRRTDRSADSSTITEWRHELGSWGMRHPQVG